MAGYATLSKRQRLHCSWFLQLSTKKESMLIKYECFQWSTYQVIIKSIFVLLAMIMVPYLLHVLASALCEYPASGLSPSHVTRIPWVCKTEPQYLAWERCSISSYPSNSKIIPGNVCFQRNGARIWNCIRAREPNPPQEVGTRSDLGWEQTGSCALLFSARCCCDTPREAHTSSLQEHICPNHCSYLRLQRPAAHARI